jgi:hypothetical protein
MLHATGGHPRTICSRLASKQHRSTVRLVESCVLTLQEPQQCKTTSVSQAHLEKNYLNLKTIPQNFVLYSRGLQFQYSKLRLRDISK